MTTPHALNLRLTLPPTSSFFTGDDVWLRMEQITSDDLASTADIAELVDELYQVDPCIAPEAAADAEEEREAMPDNKTLADLLAAAKSKMDLAECARRKSGDYTARVKVIRSHVSPPQENIYTLKPSVGYIAGISLTSEEITQTINIRNQSSLALDYPIRQDEDEEWPGTVKWLGSVWTDKDGSIPPPAVTGFGRYLSWPVECNGTLLVKFPTAYDIATVEVPGIPGAVAGSVGSTQPCTIRAFYRYQVYEAEITAVNTDTQADADSLAAVCGWSDFDGGTGGTGTGGTGSGDDDSDDEDDQNADEDDGRPETGCLEEMGQLASPEFYRQTCCKPPDGSLPDCYLYAMAKIPKEPSDAVKQEKDNKNGRNKTKYIAVGPGPEGCGRLFLRVNVNPKNCCSDVTPMSAFPDNPTTINSGGSAFMAVLDGKTDVELEWQASGGLVFDNGSNTKKSFSHGQWVYAPENVCPRSVVRADDTCTTVTMSLESGAEPLSLENISEGDVMNRATVIIAGGVPTYFLRTTGAHTHFSNGEQEIELETGGGVDIWVDKEQLCDGDFQVIASDTCGDSADVNITVKEIPTGTACIKRYTTSMNYTQWIFECSENIWIEYDDIIPAEMASYYYMKWNIPQMQSMTEIVSDYGSCSANFVYQLEIRAGQYQGLPAWVVRKNQLTNVRQVPPYCDEC